MASLPPIICLKSVYNNKYLRYRDGDVKTHGVLQFSGETAMDPLGQFEVVPASQACDGLVHLKSRYTNKYLVRWSSIHYWITASAEEPNEDQENWACTLFKPIFIIDDHGSQKARLLHVQLGHYACLWRIDVPFDSCLFAGSSNTDSDSCDLVDVIDWASILKLPKDVAFKGDTGKYLGPLGDNGKPNYLQFSYDDPNDPKVAHEVFTSPDGVVYIKSKYEGKFWRSGDGGWIVADLIEPGGSNSEAMFRPNILDINVVALLNSSTSLYCKRLTDKGERDLLSAATHTADSWACLEVTHLGP